jgi:hypothetical protein
MAVESAGEAFAGGEAGLGEEAEGEDADKRERLGCSTTSRPGAGGADTLQLRHDAKS